MSGGRDIRLVAATLAAALAVASMLAGCGGWDATFESNDYYATWLTSQPTGDQIVNSAARTGDKDVDGILAALEPIEEIQAADELLADAVTARLGGDLERAADRLDEAIGLRPDDMRYRRSRALVALQDDDAVTAAEQWREQDRIAALNGRDLSSEYWIGCEEDLYADQKALEKQPQSPERDAKLVAIYTRFSDIYNSWSVAKQELTDNERAAKLSETADRWAAQAAELAP